jgi:hypothetical protein
MPKIITSKNYSPINNYYTNNFFNISKIDVLEIFDIYISENGKTSRNKEFGRRKLKGEGERKRRGKEEKKKNDKTDPIKLI